VLGGYGATGAPAVELLRAGGDTALAAGRDPARADRVVDLRDPGHGDLLAVLTGDEVDVVLNMAGAEDPGLVTCVTDRGVAFVDVTATTGYVASLDRLAPAAPVVVDVGLAPGLTNLLAAAVHEVAPGPIDIAVVAGAAEHHGTAAQAWVYDLFGRRFADPATGRPVRNYTQPSSFELPGHGRRRLYRADFSDQHSLTRDLGVPVRTYLGLDSRLATATLALLTHVPGASRAPKGLRFPGSDRWIALARGADGTTRRAGGRLQSHATAVVAVAAARGAVAATAGWGPGVHHLHQVMTLADLPPDPDLVIEG
jgi:saccharopine dehydrogenase-like NADP-dependent oxidoreductase